MITGTCASRISNSSAASLKEPSSDSSSDSSEMRLALYSGIKSVRQDGRQSPSRQATIRSG